MHLIQTLKHSHRDVRLLWCSVLVRMVSYGICNQVLTLYLRQLGISEGKIGAFMTLTLLGDTFLSYILTWNVDRIGRRLVMVSGALLMVVSGFIFAEFSNYYVLLIAAIVGVISPSGDETGPFKSIEEATMAHLTPTSQQPEIYAFHSLFATLGAALGSLSAGTLVDYLNLNLGRDLEYSYRAVFRIYTGLAILKVIISVFLSKDVELDLTSENERLLPDAQHSEVANEGPVVTNSAIGNFLRLSPRTYSIISRLLVVFMLDSLGYGFMPAAWVIYYLKTHFSLVATTLGVLFFLTNAVDAVSSLASAHLAKKLGPVKAILFTQAPSGIFFISTGVASNFWVASTLLLLYFTTTSMDVVPRQFLLTSLINKEELAKAMGLVNIGKTYARCVGPLFTGKLAEGDYLYVGFFLSGGCVLLADIVLATNFLHYDAEIQKNIEN